MAEFPIDIIIDPRRANQGAKQVETSLDKIGSAADRVNSLIGRALGAIGVGYGLKELVNIADEYTNLRNRLRAVTSSTAELNTVTEELFNISQRTRSSMEGTAILYQRTAKSIQQFGFSQKEAFQFIETYNQALALSGATTAEATGSTIQFAQALGSGVLRGQELLSVLEQNVVAADIIAAQFNVTRGELKGLGEQGLITTDQIIKGFQKARQEMEDRFANSVPTIAQSFVVFRNALVRVIGTYNEGSGATRLFSTMLIGLANNVDEAIRIIAALAMTIGTILAAQAIPRAILAIRALTAAMVANPFGAMLVAIVAVISFLITFSDKIALTSDGMVSLRDVAVAVWRNITEAVGMFIDWFKNNFGFIATFAKKIFGDFNVSTGTILTVGGQIIDRYVGMWIAGFKIITTIFKSFPSVLAESLTKGFNRTIGIIETQLNRLIVTANQVFEKIGSATRVVAVELGRIPVVAEGASVELGISIGKAIDEGIKFSGVTDTVKSVLEDARKIADERRADSIQAAIDLDKKTEALTKGADTKKKKKGSELPTFSKLYEDLIKEGEALKLNNAEREIVLGLVKMEESLKRSLTVTEKELAEAQLRLNQELQIQADLFDQVKGPVTEYQETLKGLNSLLEQGRISQLEFNQAIQQTALVDQLKGFQTDISKDVFAGELQALEDQLLQRQVMLQQAKEAELINQQMYENLSLESMKLYNQGILDIENQRMQMQVSAAASTFSSITQIAKGFVGEQSGVYKALFAITKAFAIADATVQLTNAMAKAANSGPFPANLAAMACVAASTANLVSTITGTNLNTPGFENGGSFKVGGAGGTDSQMVSFRASPNETVSIRTPGQEKAAQGNSQNNDKPEIKLTSINVLDPGLVGEYLQTAEGGETILNVISSNSSAVQQILGGR